MMRDRAAVCLRCDRVGDAADRLCPTCGVPLYRLRGFNASAGGGMIARPDRSSGPGATVEGPGAEADPPPAPPTSTPRGRVARTVVALAAALALAAAGFSVVASSTLGSSTRSSGLTGTLVYAVRDGAWARLWRWDLATGIVREGPRVRDPLELVNASGPHPGWVGVTSQLPTGGQEGSVLRSLTAGARAIPLRAGDLISWGPRGQSVVAVRRTRLSGCRRHITVDTQKLVPSIVERQVDRRLCGDVISVGRDGVLTYFTVRTRGRVAIRFAGYGRSHPVLGGYALAAVSAASDLIVIPGRQATPSAEGLPLAGTASFFQGLGSRPVAFGTPRMPFQLYVVLGWTPDAGTALVAGAQGARSGLYLLDVGPNGQHGAPRYVSPIRGPTWATYTDRGSGIVEMDGSLYTLRGDRITPLSLPKDAPRPSGPLVWVP
jgi:hypothetical protein